MTVNDAVFVGTIVALGLIDAAFGEFAALCAAGALVLACVALEVGS